jgi:hypothetical protein
MNLRLRPDAEEELRAVASRTGRSQQDILRTAVDRYLSDPDAPPPSAAPTSPAAAPAAGGRDGLLSAAGTVLPPRTPYRRVTPTVSLPPGVTSLDLLDRDDRLRPA